MDGEGNNPADQLSASKRRELVSRRTQAKSACTRAKNYLDGIGDQEVSVIELRHRQARFRDCWQQFSESQLTLESFETSDQEIAAHEAEREAFEEKYFRVETKFEELLITRGAVAGQAVMNPGTGPVVDNNVHNTNVNMKLPRIELPTFSGSYENWRAFHDIFSTMIHTNNALPAIQKFQYLKASLKGDAAEVISSFEISQSNYTEAWAMLIERYDNQRVIVQKHIKAIFEQAILNKENYSDLRQLLDTVLKHLRALKVLGRSTDQWDDLLIHIITSKIPPITNKEWETSLKDATIPTFKQLTDFLTHRCRALEAIDRKPSTSSNQDKPFLKKSTIANVVTDKQSCSFCKGDHPLFHCSSFLELSADRRHQEIKNLKLCVNCLKSTDHRPKDCRGGSCRKCNKRHNTLLHFELNQNKDNSISQASSEKSGTTSVTSLASAESSFICQTHRALLSTAIVQIKDTKGKVHACRALLDSGSQSHFITFDMANKLGLKLCSTRIPIYGVGEAETETHSSTSVTIRSRFNAFQLKLDCLVLRKITPDIPVVSISRSDIQIPPGITLADPDFLKSAKIDMLIGVGAFWDLMCVGQIKGTARQPYWQKTHLGWIAAGGFAPKTALQSPTICNLATIDDLNKMLTRFWDIEHGARKDELTRDERQCEQYFDSTVKRNAEGRFIVKLPIKIEEMSRLGESKETAIRRFKNLERRLTREPELKDEYTKFIHEYESLGRMRKLNDVESSTRPHYYLPHHCVLKENNCTTRLRVVFDASCKTTTGVSLNDALMVGPTLQQDLFSILTRFRTFKYVLVADIAKMYRQVLVDKSQTSLQRIIWRDNVHNHLDEFELLTVTYGTGPASFLAIKALRTLAEMEADAFSVGSRIAMRDFYVDDLITGANTMVEAVRIRDEIIALLAKGGFDLRKWATNDSQLLQDIPIAATTNAVLSLDKDGSFKTLGVQWNPASDSFQYKIIADSDRAKRVTKRTILSDTAQIFDPLGLLGPVIVSAKILIQKLWTLHLDWDESLPIGLYTQWIIFTSELKQLNELRIPRRAIHCAEVGLVELHGFCDASQDAYGACVYLRTTDSEGKHSTCLLCSKSRVAPLKAVSIPRLELCGALLLAQLIEKVASILDFKVNATQYWTDSRIVIDWIRSPSRKFTAFVANRIGEIQQITAIDNWHHVGTKENPADILSRGTNPASFMQQQTWWSGPLWLKEDRSSWPKIVPSIEISDDLPEQCKLPIAALVSPLAWNLTDRFSSLTRMVKAVAMCLRFAHNARSRKTGHPKKLGPVSACEIDSALKIIVKKVQEVAFHEEIESLRKGDEIAKKSRLSGLSPFIDPEGLLRVGGRLRNANMSYAAKHPQVLPGHHKLTQLIIEDEHKRGLHAGPQTTLSAVRARYWPIGARNIVRSVIKKCIVCFKAKPHSSVQIMGDLPSPRVNPSRPFSNVGVDYCGPIYLREGKRRNAKKSKAWIAIFVCLATKAIHIEIVSDLSADGFIGALKRFVGRRGKPSDIFSDNGTNFVGANHELEDLRTLFNREEVRRKIVNETSFDAITWHFIPPRAPHHGGLWEAAVRSMKHHLCRVTGEGSLTFEEAATILIQIEAILNSRPLTPMSSDPNDQSYLTPGHFLIGDSLTSHPEPSLLHLPLNRLSRWQRIEQIRQHFWKRWVSDYLHQMQQRSKWKRSNGPQLEVGQLVVVREDNLPPHSWVIGRIIQTHPGPDDVVRAASVKTSRGIIKRASPKLCILPIEQ